jgi:hypothetical protein
LPLKAVGYLIAANYTENDEAAEKSKVAMVLESAFKGITINTLAPGGYVGTGMLRAVPEDAIFITGDTLTASGEQCLA